MASDEIGKGGDLISREQAKAALGGDAVGNAVAQGIIRSLPSIAPDPVEAEFTASARPEPLIVEDGNLIAVTALVMLGSFHVGINGPLSIENAEKLRDWLTHGIGALRSERAARDGAR